MYEIFDDTSIQVILTLDPGDSIRHVAQRIHAPSVREIEGPLQIVLEPRTDFDIEWVEGYPVIPRDETIAYIQEHFVHFQPALAMLDRMYDDIEVCHKDG